MSAALELATFGITANIVNPPVTDTGWVTANQGQAQQLRLPFDAGQNAGVRNAEILETGIHIRFAFCVQKRDQTEAVGEPADLGRCHRLWCRSTIWIATRRSLKNLSAARVSLDLLIPKT
jgi:NAD(P)-dependent dehydrogenase (short-subunit alcohol dehydrogenase family)